MWFMPMPIDGLRDALEASRFSEGGAQVLWRIQMEDVSSRESDVIFVCRCSEEVDPLRTLIQARIFRGFQGIAVLHPFEPVEWTVLPDTIKRYPIRPTMT
jgi:hypothetical protein